MTNAVRAVDQHVRYVSISSHIESSLQVFSAEWRRAHTATVTPAALTKAN